MRPVVVAQRKAHVPIVGKLVARRDGCALAIKRLPCHGGLLGQGGAIGKLEVQIASFFVHAHAIRPGVAPGDLCRVGPGGDGVGAFQAALGPVVAQRDAGVKLCIDDARVGRQVRAPLRWVAANKIVDDAGQPLGTRDRRRRRDARKLHPYHGWRLRHRGRVLPKPVAGAHVGPGRSRLGRWQRQHNLGVGEEDRPAHAAHLEAHGGVSLPRVGHEGERQPAKVRRGDGRVWRGMRGGDPHLRQRQRREHNQGHGEQQQRARGHGHGGAGARCKHRYTP